MDKNNIVDVTIKRVGGYLQKITTIADSTGKVIQTVMSPFMVELRLRDIMQIIVGASILAIPVGFTEEAWSLGEKLPLVNVMALSFLSLIFIVGFVYYNFYRFTLKGHVSQYIKRVIVTYLLSLFVVGVLLTIIQVCPWGANNLLALKRIIIIAFPASMSATVSDALK